MGFSSFVATIDTSTTHTHTRREPVASVGSVFRDPPSSGMELCVSVKRQTKELRWSRRRRRLHWLRWTKKTIGPGCEFWSLITADWSSRKFGSHDPLLQASYKYRLHYYYIVSERRLSVRFSATPPSLRYFFLFFFFTSPKVEASNLGLQRRVNKNKGNIFAFGLLLSIVCVCVLAPNWIFRASRGPYWENGGPKARGAVDPEMDKRT